MNRACLAIVAVLAVLVGALCAGCDRPDPREAKKKSDDAQAAPQTVDELKARVAEILAEEHIPGAGIALVTKDRVEWSGGVGKADVAKGIDVTADTMFRVGSITKCFVALALERLVMDQRTIDGKPLAFDAKLKELAPEIAFENAWEAMRPITVAHLLEHTAGFDDFRPPEYVAMRPDVPLRDVLAVDPRSRVSRWAPGTRHSYSNPGYTIAGYLIEKASGRAFEDYIAETLLRPLGMPHADLRRTPAVDARLAQGYVDGKPTPVDYIAIQHRPAGNLHASPAELARLVLMWLGRGTIDGVELFTPETIASMEKPRTLPPNGLGVGYGFASYTALVHGWIAHGHNGGIDGFLSEAMYIPERGVGWVVLINTTAGGSGLERLRRAIARYLLRDAPPPDLPTGLALSDAGAKYAGYYAVANPRIELLAALESLLGGRTVFVRNGQLWERSFLETPKRLVPTGVLGGFRGEDEGATRVFFTKDASDADVMLSGMRYFEKTPAWKIRVHRGIVLSAFGLMASSVLFALVWGPRWLMRKPFRARARPMATRVAPLVASLFAFASVAVLMSLNGVRHFIPLVNPRTVASFVLPLLFLVSSGAALGYALRSILRRHELGRWVKLHSLLVSIAACVFVLWMAYWRMMGLRLWDW